MDDSSAIVFLSTFDPIDAANLSAIRFALMSLEMDSALLVTLPSREGETRLKDRCRMVEAAIEDMRHLSSLEREEIKGCDNLSELLSIAWAATDSSSVYLMVDPLDIPRLLEEKIPDDVLAKFKGLIVVSSKIQPEIPNLGRLPVQTLYNPDMEAHDPAGIRQLSHLDTALPVIDYILDKHLYAIDDLRDLYTRQRYEHAVSVAHLAWQMAQENGQDSCQAFLAGLLHDCAKELAHTDEGKELMQKHFPQFANFPLWSYHQFLGALVAHERFHVRDGEVLEAIFYHTTGFGEMNALDKIIYCADKLDPERGWDSQPFIDLCLQDIDAGFKAELKHNMEYIDQKNPDETKDPLTAACMERYLREE